MIDGSVLFKMSVRHGVEVNASATEIELPMTLLPMINKKDEDYGNSAQTSYDLAVELLIPNSLVTFLLNTISLDLNSHVNSKAIFLETIGFTLMVVIILASAAFPLFSQ
jgi:hypothetical protein